MKKTIYSNFFFVYLFTFILVAGFILPILQPLQLQAKSIFSQSVLFEYQVTEKNIFYSEGKLKNEFNNSTLSNKYSTYGQNYLLKSRTAFQHDYFAVLLDYAFSYNFVTTFNSLKNSIAKSKVNRKANYLEPYLFSKFDPIRLGISYRHTFDTALLSGEQPWSLQNKNALSFHFQFYFSQLGPAPLGINLDYQLSIDPTISSQENRDTLYHKVSLGLNINFNYYGQFKMLFTYINKKGDFNFYKIASDTAQENFNTTYLKRYYTDFTYNFQVLEYLAFMFGVGRMVYSQYESPTLRLLFGITYQLPITY